MSTEVQDMPFWKSVLSPHTDKTGIFISFFGQVAANDLQMLVDEKVSQLKCLSWKEKCELILGGRAQEAEGRGPFCGKNPEEPTRKDPQEKSCQSFRLTSERECDLQKWISHLYVLPIYVNLENQIH